MAKKSRRSRNKRATRKVVRTAITPLSTERSPQAPATQVQATPVQGIVEQYAYVYDDLKRIAVLAGTLLVVLVALSFVIG
jgi:hypothetical protein